MIRILIIIIGLLVHFSGKSQTKDPRHFIISDTLTELNLTYNRPIYLNSTNPPDPQQFNILRRVSQDGYIVIPSINKELELEEYALFEVNDHWKLASNLHDWDTYQVLRKDKIQLIIQFWGTSHWPDYIHILNRFKNNWLQIEIDPKEFPNLLSHPQVVYIEKIPGDTRQVESYLSDVNYSLSGIEKVKSTDPNLDGNQFVVSLKEALYDVQDFDLIDKNIFSGWEATFENNHATDMATIIAGIGNTSPNNQAIANQAHISSVSFENLFPEPPAYFEAYNIHLQNHSYGSTVENFYSSLAWSLDTLCNNLPDLLHIFSAGNRRTDEKSGTYSNVNGYGDITGSYKMSKNTLAVSSINREFMPLAENASGPAYDGRLKPEIVAYSESGTSNAAATVSSVATILQQAYFNQFNAYPDAALIRNILMNTARDVGAPGIDYKTGYGMINTPTALECLQKEQFINDTLSGDNPKSHVLHIPKDAGQIKIMLTWTDPPGIIDASHALVHDLDLQVKVGDLTYYPQVLNTYPDPDSLAMLPVLQKDHTNIMEQVTIDQQLDTDSIQILVSGEIPGVQPYFITYTYEIAEQFCWDYPLHGKFYPYSIDQPASFLWSTTFKEPMGSLSISLDSGLTWQPISEVSLSNQAFHWNPSNSDLGIAQAKMTILDTNWISDYFVISTPLEPEVVFNCSSAFLLSWHSRIDVTSYTLYRWYNGQLDSFTTVQDTFVYIQKSDFQSTNYCILPRYPFEQNNLRSSLYDLEFQNPECYITNWYGGTAENGESIDLLLELNSIFHVDQIQVLKEVNPQDFIPITTVEAPMDLFYSFNDKDPERGPNAYKVILYFIDGTILDEDLTMVQYTPQNRSVLFPNPLSSLEDLTLQTNPSNLSDDLVFTIYDLNGQKLYSQKINFSFQTITWYERSAGLYFYRLNGSTFEQSGKIMIL